MPKSGLLLASSTCCSFSTNANDMRLGARAVLAKLGSLLLYHTMHFLSLASETVAVGLQGSRAPRSGRLLNYFQLHLEEKKLHLPNKKSSFEASKKRFKIIDSTLSFILLDF